jgi:hypothetical protein
MISNQHYVELYINKQLIELESQESLNLRINSVLFNPTKTTTTQAEYSYSFTIPSTPNNDRILDYANNLSKLNKFHARYNAQVYADGALIFDGSLTIQKYSAKDKKYTCNLVNIKVNTLDEIFGDMVLTDLKWEVDYDGAPSIIQANMSEIGYYFPLVCYGAFQKSYVSKDDVGATYTPKNVIDQYNKWWIDSFYPSLNVVETMRKAFENKGYKVGGSVFSDAQIKEIYASCNLASEQVPEYNLGNSKFGMLSVNVTWNNYSKQGLAQELRFPYEPVRPAINAANSSDSTQYNFDVIDVWNMMESGNTGVSVSLNADTYMYDPTEQLIVIPADGWYKIKMDVNASLSGAGTNFTAPLWYNTFYDGDSMERQNKTLQRGFSKWKGGYFTPLEIQLVRNYNTENNSIELIKGKYNAKWASGDPNESTYHYEGGSYTGSTSTNMTTGYTEFPHQDLYGAQLFTKQDELIASTSQTTRNELLKEFGGNISSNTNTGFGGGSGSFGGGGRRNARASSGFGGGSSNRGKTQYNCLGFMTKNGKVMPYDPAVSTAFICGFSTMSDGQVSVMKNGYSWSSLSTVKNSVMANVAGLDLYNLSGGNIDIVDTTYCQNTYKNCPDTLNRVSVSNSTLNGSVCCLVYLNKNDVLELMAVQRDHNGQKYYTSAAVNLMIQAMSPRNEAALRGDTNWSGYYSGTEFPTKLNLFNFTNQETKVKDWIESIKKAFNLEIIQQGDTVEINTNQGLKKNITYAVDIDDRVSSDEAESEFISYPKEMSVQYKTDIEEYGFELTVPKEHINDSDWYKYGDSGFTVIQLNDDSYQTESSNTTTNFSYTYFMDFDFYQIHTDGTSATTPTTKRVAVIEKSEYMAEGYGYEEAMKHDGYSLAQRFWYKDYYQGSYVILSSVLSNGQHETVPLLYTTNYQRGTKFNLSYKDNEKSIVTEYFNIHPMLSSNYVTVEVYLTPQEYQNIKDGAMVKFDSDLYYVSEISGYDCSGHNTTKLKLIKKI